MIAGAGRGAARGALRVARDRRVDPREERDELAAGIAAFVAVASTVARTFVADRVDLSLIQGSGRRRADELTIKVQAASRSAIADRHTSTERRQHHAAVLRTPIAHEFAHLAGRQAHRLLTAPSVERRKKNGRRTPPRAEV